MGPLPATSCGNKYILVVTDLFSKWVEAFPLAVTDSITTARILTDEVICRYGAPKSLHSDQGANFVSEVCDIQLCVLLPRDRNLYVLHIALTTRVFSVLIAIY